jgi:endonuclease YncB( thermonuclease family)
MNIDWNNIDENVPDFHHFLENQNKICKCVKVIDGDTIKVVTDINGKLWKINIRLSHIDCPELHSRNLIEKNRAIFVKEELTKKINNKLINIQFGVQEKYGRLLADVYLNDEYINDWLINNKYAIKYEGKTKIDWSLILK